MGNSLGACRLLPNMTAQRLAKQSLLQAGLLKKVAW
jgi:hypothetical protein